jgi:hypothetical protein
MFELWQILSNAGHTEKTFDEFRIEYSSEENKKVLYDKLKESNNTERDYEDFSLKYFSNYGVGPSDIKVTSTEPQTEFTSEEKKSGRLTYKQQQDLIHGREFTEPVYKKKPLTSDQFNEFANAVNYSITDLNKKESLVNLGIDIKQFNGLSIAEQLKNIQEAGKKGELDTFVIDNALEYIKQGTFLQDNNISEEEARDAIAQISTRKDYIGQRLQFDANQFKKEQKELIQGIQVTEEALNEWDLQAYNDASREDKRIMALNRQQDALKRQLKTADGEAAFALKKQIEYTQKEIDSNIPLAWKNLSLDEKRKLSYYDRQRLAGSDSRKSYTGIDGNPINLSDDEINAATDQMLQNAAAKPELTIRESLEQENLDLLKEQKLWSIEGKEMVAVSRKEIQAGRGREVLAKNGYNLYADNSEYFNIPVKDLYNANLFLTGEAKAAVESYGIWKTNLDKKRIAINELYHYNRSPEELENFKIINFGAAAIKASGILGSQDKSANVLKDNRSTLDIIKDFEIQYNSINEDKIQKGEVPAIAFNKDQEKAFERTMADNIVEGTGAFVPMIAEFAALEFLTGGIGGGPMLAKSFLKAGEAGGISGLIGLTDYMQKLSRSKSTLDRFKLAGILMGKEEVKTQLAGFKTGSGVAFSGVGQLIPNARLGFLSGTFNKLIKGGFSGAVAGEVAGLTEAAIGSVTGDENFQHFLDVNYRDISGKEIAERIFTNAAVFGLIGGTHLKKTDVSYKAYKKETALHELQKYALDRKISLIEQVNKGEKTLEEVQEDGITKEMLTEKNVQELKDMQYSLNKFLEARRGQEKWDPESPTFETDAKDFLKNTFKGLGLELGDGKDIKLEFVDSVFDLEGVDKIDPKTGKELKENQVSDSAKWVPSENKFQFVKNRFSSGKFAHEIFHGGLKAFFHNKPNELRRFNTDLVGIITKTLNIGEGEQGDKIAKAIKDMYGLDLRKKLDKNIQAEELMANIVELLASPYFRTQIDYISQRGFMHEIKDNIYNFLERKGFNKFTPEINTGQDLIDFLGRFAYNVNTGKNVSKQIERLSDISLFGDSKEFLKNNIIASSKDIVTESEKKDIFSKAEKAYEQFAKDNIDSAGLMVGVEFEPIISKMADRIYRDVPGYEMEKQNIISDVMMETRPGYGGVPALVKSWSPEGGAKLTSYIFGNLPKRIIGIVNKHYPSLGRTRGFEEGETAKFAEDQGLGGESRGFVDISSPELTTRVNAKKAETVLQLKPESVKEFDRVAEMETKFKFPDIEAKNIIEYSLGEKGNASVSYYANNTANVIINGKAEKIKARTPKDVEQYLNKKGFNIESQEKIGNFRQQKINSFRTQLYDVLQAEAGGTINKGTAASPEYSAFIDKSFTLYKDYFSQSSVNKRFADFKEPVIDKATGKQAREKTAQGNPIFTKKNITKAEWIKYFKGDGNVRIDARRRALLETIAEEIGFDKIMEKVYDQSKQEQIRSRQAELGVELVENFAVILGKQLDRLPGDQIVFASKNITEAFDNLVGENKSYTKEEFARVLVLAGKVDSGYLKFEHPDIYNLLESEVAERLGIEYKKIFTQDGKSFSESIKNRGITDAILVPPRELNKEQKALYENAIMELVGVLPPYLYSKTGGKQVARTPGAFISSVLGFNDRNGLTTKRFNDLIQKRNKSFGQDYRLLAEISPEVKNAWEKFNQLISEGTGTFKFKTDALGLVDKIKFINEKNINEKQKQIEIDNFLKTQEGKKLLKDIEASEAFLDATLLTINSIAKDINFANEIAPLFIANDGLNLIRLFSPFKTIELKEGGFEKAGNEHLKAKARFASDVFYDIYNNNLTAERLTQLKQNWRSILGEEKAQEAADKVLGKIYEGYASLKLSFLGREVVSKEGDFKIDVAIENLKNLYNFVEGKSEYDLLVNEIATDFVNNTKGLNLATARNIVSEALSEKTIFASKDITEKFDNMLTRRTGLGGEVSPSKARQLGKGKGKFDLYIPPNAEDFAGLLYKLYGKGDQGDADMALARETLLLPYERGENAISTYRQQISQKFKDFNKKLKAFDMKFDKDAVKNIEDAGFTVDQAIRVWIWEKLGYDIPNITLKEQTELSNIVSKNPKLLASAISFKNMFGAGRPYPEPKGDWYASNIKFDAHRYINEGARKMFLEEFITNADAIFTPEFYSKAEAGLGLTWVKNMKEMLNAMKTGRSTPTNLPEYAVIGLNYINGAVGNIMFLNGRSAVLQTISMANFVNWSDNNILAVGKTLADPKNFGKTFMELMNSDFLKQRRDGLEISVEEAEIAKSLRETKNPLSHLWGKMIQLGYAPTKFADSFAIAAGGAPFYINRTKTYEAQGFSNAEAKKMAFDDFRMLSETHQQSSRQDKVSNVQRGLTGRLVYSFSGAPFQMAREQKKAALDFINRRGDDKTNISKFIYYGAMQNLLFTALQQGIFASAFEDDEVLAGTDKRTKRLANSMLDTGLRSSGLPGAMLAMGKNAIIKYMEENEKGYQGDMGNVVGEVLNVSPPVGAKFRNIYKGLQSRKFLLHTKKGRAEVEASNNFIENPLMHANARILGGITNYPVNRLMTKADNLTTAYTGLHRGVEADAWQRVFLTAGWDKWSLGFYEKSKEEGPKKTRSEKMKEVWAEKRQKEWQEDSIKNARMLLNVKPGKIKKINF